jgi:hypothetical protein
MSFFDFLRRRAPPVAADDDGPVCPVCHSRSVASIVYGLLSDSAFRATKKRRDIVVGGCFVEPHSPEWHCHECGHEFGRSGGGAESK